MYIGAQKLLKYIINQWAITLRIICEGIFKSPLALSESCNQFEIIYIHLDGKAVTAPKFSAAQEPPPRRLVGLMKQDRAEDCGNET
jgi:hypothetical protein